MTAIAVIRTPKLITVAADTKEVCADGSSANCTKFFEEGGCFFVLTGLRESSAAAFDPVKFARDACRLGASMRDRAHAFARAVEQPLRTALTYVWQNSRNDFEKHLKGRDALGVIFFGVVSGRVDLAYVVFKAAPKEEAVDVSIEIGPSTQHQWVFFSAPDSVPLPTADPIAAVRDFMKRAITNHPDFIGEPIEILQLTRHGPTWVQRLT